MSQQKITKPIDTLQPWSDSVDETVAALEVDPAQGLLDKDVAARRQRYGLNRLKSTKRRNALEVAFAQFRSVVILLLIAVAGLSFAFGDLPEAFAVIAVIVINTSIGFVTELRAVRSIEALRMLGRVETTVRRDSQAKQVPAESLVPGDIVLIEGGDIVTADLRIIEASKLEADESTLTGESAPVPKDTSALQAETHLTERTNMLFKGSSVTRGSGVAVVTGIGVNTQLGEITKLVIEADAEDTPLEKRLDALGRRLVLVTAIITAFVGIAGVLSGRDMVLAIEVAIALAVATIPEGLPIVATIALARGMWRMARRNALISKLSAVETLGATSVILTDKTGTLTENQMTVTQIAVDDTTLSLSGTGLEIRGDLELEQRDSSHGVNELARELLSIAALCNNASLQHSTEDIAVKAVGDPTEVALLVAAAKLGIKRPDLMTRFPEVLEEPFDTATKAMATVHDEEGEYLVAVKGAPEAILEKCVAVRTLDGDIALSETLRSQWLEKSKALGSKGLRTLAMATKRTSDMNEAPYSELTLLGIVGVQDPPRAGVRDALAACRDAGIAVVMVTGDHAATAHAIAHDLGLIVPDAPDSIVIDGRLLDDVESLSDVERRRLTDAQVIARASPEQKLDLIYLHQQLGHVVAMTGDGVNDAPALKKADIGIAMGQRGTQVAKEASAMILQDDKFESIVEAVAQGRAIYTNIRKFVIYLMSCNLSEVLIVALATLVNAPLPLLPLQILFLNLVTDVFPALALGVGEGSPSLMKARPRSSKEPILTRRHWLIIGVYGVIMCMSVLGAMATAVYVLGFEGTQAVTISFLTLAFAQLWHVFNMRDDHRHWLRNEVTENFWVWGAIVLCVILILTAVYLPGLSGLLSISNPGLSGWIVILVMSAIPVIASPAVRLILASR